MTESDKEFERLALLDRVRELEKERAELRTMTDRLAADCIRLEKRVDERDRENGTLLGRVRDLETQVADTDLAFNYANEIIGKLQGDVDRLEAERKGHARASAEQLLLIEWVDGHCPACRRSKVIRHFIAQDEYTDFPGWHSDDCWLAAAIKEAQGVNDGTARLAPEQWTLIDHAKLRDKVAAAELITKAKHEQMEQDCEVACLLCASNIRTTWDKNRRPRKTADSADSAIKRYELWGKLYTKEYRNAHFRCSVEEIEALISAVLQAKKEVNK